MKEWKEYKLGEIVIKATSGGTPSTKVEEYYNGQIPWLNTKEVDFKRIFKTEKTITEKGLSNSSAKWIPENSVIVAMYGATAAKVAINKIPLTTNQACCNLIINKKIANYEFVFYNIWNNYHELENIAVGAAQQNLSVGVIKEFTILLPPLPEQKAIASVLSSLDDKIDLLHQQNQTLEALAETLFREWFSDLDYKSSLKDIIDIQSGYAFKSKTFIESGTERVIKIKNISSDIVDVDNSDFVNMKTTQNLDSKFLIEEGDILFAMTGAKIGKMGIVPKSNDNLWLNQRVALFKEKFHGSKYLAYMHLKTDFGLDYIESTATGSAQPNISATGIEQCEFPKLSENLIIEYSKQLAVFYEKIVFNLGEIQTLTQLRDTLLPKLMSGEVRLKM